MDDRVEHYSASRLQKTGVSHINYACCDCQARLGFARSPPAIRAAQYARIAPYGRHPPRLLGLLAGCSSATWNPPANPGLTSTREADLQRCNTGIRMGRSLMLPPWAPGPRTPAHGHCRRWRPIREAPGLKNVLSRPGALLSELLPHLGSPAWHQDQDETAMCRSNYRNHHDDNWPRVPSRPGQSSVSFCSSPE